MYFTDMSNSQPVCYRTHTIIVVGVLFILIPIVGKCLRKHKQIISPQTAIDNYRYFSFYPSYIPKASFLFGIIHRNFVSKLL